MSHLHLLQRCASGTSYNLGGIISDSYFYMPISSRATFAMPSTGRSILMNGTANFSVMDSWKSILLSLMWCLSFTVHLWLEGGHPKEKVGYLYINVSAAVTFQLYALHLEYSFLSLSIQFFYSII